MSKSRRTKRDLSTSISFISLLLLVPLSWIERKMVSFSPLPSLLFPFSSHFLTLRHSFSLSTHKILAPRYKSSPSTLFFILIRVPFSLLSISWSALFFQLLVFLSSCCNKRLLPLLSIAQYTSCVSLIYWIELLSEVLEWISGIHEEGKERNLVKWKSEEKKETKKSKHDSWIPTWFISVPSSI